MAPITAGGAPVAPASPAALTPSGLVVAGTSVSSEVNAGKVVGARHAVVLEAAGHELTVAIVDDRLHQRLADALRHAAMDLALAEQVVHHPADVVDRGIAHDRDRAGLADRPPPRRRGSRWDSSAARAANDPAASSPTSNCGGRCAGR